MFEHRRISASGPEGTRSEAALILANEIRSLHVRTTSAQYLLTLLLSNDSLPQLVSQTPKSTYSHTKSLTNNQSIHKMDDQEPEISQKDTQSLLMILRSLKEPLTNSMVDIPAFAKKAGLTPGSAKNVLIKLRRKIDDTTVGNLHTVTEAKVKKNPPKKAPATRKKKVENKIETKVESDEEDEERSE